ncbi:efflux RND transporter periplasmic adaptor subunit [Mariprofundus erugo]|uniref:Efflux RND transporter periplasmic adaptor subunit n=1 Tax=Mariprofundus erugo TaxID=2528639 RepID=A0A5R9GMC8_9PROT|nr:efflux RND transporter periplasmic adaptor subunit [Mariprofundus erugo]TLS66255.1 efflux RND transporter periplasmic adaptor subunit [Mariprofundus erugo]
MKQTRMLIWLMAVMLFAAPAMAEEEQAAPEEAVTHQVRAVTVTRQDVKESLHAYGKVSFDDGWLQNISLAYAGQLLSLPVVAGEAVAKDQMLAEMAADPAAAATYQQADSAVHFAAAEVARVRRLLADQLATRSQLAAAEKVLADSQSQLQQLKQQGLGHGMMEIKAPFDAIVAAVPVQAGQRLAAGTTLMQLGNPDRLKVLLGVEAEDLHQVAVGSDVVIHPSMDASVSVHATVSKVLHAVNPQTRLADVLVRLSGEQTMPFIPGMAVSAEISAGSFHDALLIPRQALVYDADSHASVMVIREGKAVKVAVEVALEKEQDAVVRGALEAGDQIATIGVAEIEDGDAVEVVAAP